MKEHYRNANEIVMSEPQIVEFVDAMNIDEDPTLTYGKLLLLTDDQTVSQTIKEDVILEPQFDQLLLK